MPVASGLPNNGRFQWRLPDGLPNTPYAHLRITVASGGDSAAAITPTPFSVAGGASEPTLYVAGIRLRGRLAPGGYKAQAVIRLKDQMGNAVPGAVVTAVLTPPVGPPRVKTALTNPNGIARAQWRSPAAGAWEACVDDVFHPAYVYDPDQNLETCDSFTYP
jgi:hypothetical protein